MDIEQGFVEGINMRQTINQMTMEETDFQKINYDDEVESIRLSII